MQTETSWWGITVVTCNCVYSVGCNAMRFLFVHGRQCNITRLKEISLHTKRKIVVLVNRRNAKGLVKRQPYVIV